MSGRTGMTTQLYGGPQDGYVLFLPDSRHLEPIIYYPYLDRRARGKFVTELGDLACEPLVRYRSVYRWDDDDKRYRYTHDERC